MTSVLEPILNETADEGTSPAHPRRWWPDRSSALAIGWMFFVAFLFLLPALLHGLILGPQDILSTYGLGTQSGVQPHNLQSSDQVMDMMPWTALAWQQVHQGHLPLWNPYSGLGLPLAFNFQAAPFSLPTIISYLFPLKYSYTIIIYIRLVVAGTGVWWLCRRLRLSNLTASFGGMVFELSGSLTAWIGWPHANVACWFGWVFGSILLVLEGGRRRVGITALAVSVAMAAYGGHPETFALMCLSATLFATTRLFLSYLRTRQVWVAIERLTTLAIGAVAGIALASPLLLPGLQVLNRSVRTRVPDWAISWKDTVNLVFPSFHGLPVKGNVYFDTNTFYETACYVGIISLVLATVAAWDRRRRGIVLSFGILIPVAMVATYSKLFAKLVNALPLGGELQWNRMELLLDLVLAVLAAVGLELLRTRLHERWLRKRFLAVALVSLGLFGLVAVFRGDLLEIPQLAFIQSPLSSFLWPSIDLLVILLLAFSLLDTSAVRDKPHTFTQHLSRSWLVIGALFVAQATFLLTAAPTVESSSSSFFPVTGAEATLQQLAGSDRVGMGSCPLFWRPTLGILPEANSAYGVAEVAAFDGVVPTSYFDSYYTFTGGKQPHNLGFAYFCPSIKTASLARHFGVSEILEPAGVPGPQGTVRLGSAGSEGVYQVPRSGLVTTAPLGADPDGPDAQAILTKEVSPTDLRFQTDSTIPSKIYIHITDFPGWSATIDGHPLKLEKWAKTMWSASIPAGPHSIRLSYLPRAFEVGVGLAFLVVLVLAGSFFWHIYRIRRGLPPDRSDDSEVNNEGVAFTFPVSSTDTFAPSTSD